MPLSQTFSKPISIHYGSPCFLNRFRITFCPFQEGTGGPHSFFRIFYFSGATCLAFYVIALMGNSCYVKSEILLNYSEAGYGNWHYVKTLHHHFISRHIWAIYTKQSNEARKEPPVCQLKPTRTDCIGFVRQKCLSIPENSIKNLTERHWTLVKKSRLKTNFWPLEFPIGVRPPLGTIMQANTVNSCRWGWI